MVTLKFQWQINADLLMKQSRKRWTCQGDARSRSTNHGNLTAKQHCQNREHGDTSPDDAVLKPGILC